MTGSLLALAAFSATIAGGSLRSCSAPGCVLFYGFHSVYGRRFLGLELPRFSELFRDVSLALIVILIVLP